MKKSALFRKFILFYLLFVCGYSVIAAGLFYYKNSEMLDYRLDTTHKQFLLQARDKIDTVMQTGLSMINEVKLNADTQTYAASNELDYYRVTKVYQAISGIVNSFARYGIVMSVQKPGDDLIISSRSTESLDLFYYNLGLSSEQRSGLVANLSDPNQQHRYYVADNGRDLLTIAKRETLANNSVLIFYLSFYKDQLMPQIEPTLEEGFALSNWQGVVSQQFGGIEPDRVAKMLNQLQNLEPYNTYMKRIFGSQSVHLIGSSVFTGWNYMYVVPRSLFIDKLSQLLTHSLYVSVILGTVGILGAWMAASRMYRPIRKMVSLFSEYADPNADDELSVLQKASDKAKKAHEALSEAFATSRVPLAQRFLRDALFGFLKDEEIQERREQLHLDDMAGPLVVVLLEFADYGAMAKNLSKDGILSIHKQMLILIDEIREGGMGYPAVELDQLRYALIVKQSQTAAIEHLVGRLTDGILPHSEYGLVSAIGKPVGDLPDIAESYDSAVGLLEYRHTLGSKYMITFDDIGDLASIDYYYPLEVERDLIYHVVQGQKEQAVALLHKISEENFGKRLLSGEAISTLIFLVIATINRIATVAKIDGQSLGGSLYTELARFDNYAELQRRIEEIFGSLIDRIQERKGDSEDTMSDRMLQFIHSNYVRDISLQDIAEHLRLSPAHASRVFKSYIGDNFKDYLNRYRIRMAKEIMTVRHVKIEELALMVGCNNATTFARMFKKYEGYPPGKFYDR